jgi:hypothetical protein
MWCIRGGFDGNRSVVGGLVKFILSFEKFWKLKTKSGE